MPKPQTTGREALRATVTYAIVTLIAWEIYAISAVAVHTTKEYVVVALANLIPVAVYVGFFYVGLRRFCLRSIEWPVSLLAAGLGLASLTALPFQETMAFVFLGGWWYPPVYGLAAGLLTGWICQVARLQRRPSN